MNMCWQKKIGIHSKWCFSSFYVKVCLKITKSSSLLTFDDSAGEPFFTCFTQLHSAVSRVYKEYFFSSLSFYIIQAIYITIMVGKTGSLGPWNRVIVYWSKLSFCQNDPPMGESFCQKESLLQYTMTLLLVLGPKDPVLPTIITI